MRPIKLVMSAFGPFAEEVTIDFRRLGNSGLYLVTGDTGAGKTTIFDAISYALYGATSGDFRDGKMLRSKYAGLDTTTFVELTFEAQGKEYVVTRIPDQKRAKMRGEGEAQQKAEAILTYPDSRQPVTKIADVDKAVKEIVGLDRKQFSQITMLAQGEFRKMLLATTDEKQKIFRDIFSTWDYEKLQETMKERYLKKRKEYDKRREDILRDIALLEYGADFEKKEELEQFKVSGQLVGRETFQEWMKHLLERDEQIVDDYDRQLQCLEDRLQQLNTRIGAANERQKSVEERKHIEVELDASRKALIDRENALQEADKQVRDADGLNAEAMRIETRLEDYNRYTELRGEVAMKREGLEGLEQHQAQRRIAIEQSEQSEKHLREVLEGNREAEVKILGCQQELQAIRERREAVEVLMKDYDKGKELQLACEDRQQEYRRKSADFERMAKEHAEHEKLFFDAQAGVLAQLLEEGKPCPVCGSMEHPQPATRIAEVATREQLDEEKERIDKARELCQQASIHLVQSREQLEQHGKQCAEKLDKLFGVQRMKQEKLVEENTRLSAQIVAQEQDLQRWENAKKEYDKAERELPRVVEQSKQLAFEFQNAEQEKVVYRTEIQKLSEQLEHIKSGLQFDSVDAAKKAVEQLRERAALLVEEQKKAANALQELRNILSAQEGRKASLEKLLSTQPDEDLTALWEERNLAIREKQQKEKLRNFVYARHEKNITLVDRVNTGWCEFEVLEREYLAVKTLSDTMNGELAGRDKIKLETYIQMAYFERVLEKANVRLLGMTDGQYELVRSEQADNQRSQSGLDVNVYDYYTSAERSVKSLSGGESFMASLALALGLADEIQSATGGIQMDTLFVDEGFGSLDDDTLKRAMKELDKLTEGNRLVGIISHVADLKGWIDKQIVVTKMNHVGSRIEMIV